MTRPSQVAAENAERTRRFLAICNACRYCEGYCAVFPAMELRRDFSAADVRYLSNLCHDCRGCYYACPFTPPHEFELNLPQAFALERTQSYAEYAWPRPLAAAFSRNGTVVALVTVACMTVVMLLAARFQTLATFPDPHDGPGAFYAVLPEAAMDGVAGAVVIFALCALLIGFLNFWHDTSPRDMESRDRNGGRIVQARPLRQALADVFTLRNLGGGGHGCNDRDAEFSQSRRRAHHAMFYGFALCFGSTCSAFLYEHVAGLVAPYPFLSVPVLLGTAGGIGMVAGAGGLAWIKLGRDQAPVAKAPLGSDYAFLLLMFLAAATGLVLLGFRHTAAMSTLLALHLGVILAVFFLLPYSKFVHSIYRFAALLRHAGECP